MNSSVELFHLIHHQLLLEYLMTCFCCTMFRWLFTYRTVSIWEIFWNFHDKLEYTILVRAHPDKNNSKPY